MEAGFNDLLVRVGGGFINIEDFLEQNVSGELSKLAAKGIIYIGFKA